MSRTTRGDTPRPAVRVGNGLAGLALALWVLALAPPAALAAEGDVPPAAMSPEERARLEREANQLNARAVALHRDGRSADAIELFRQALDLYQRLYPEGQYPNGHPHLAAGLNNLGYLLQLRGEYGRARDHLERALAMYHKLYPEDRHKDGHPHLANCLGNLGALFKAQGEYGRARPYYERALAMYQRLYPEEKYKDGHPDLARSLNTLGWLLQDMEEYGRARDCQERALAMRQRLFPAAQHPDGHPDLAMSLSSLGSLLGVQGEYGRARDYQEQALAMRRRLYPAARYPDGHPDLALSLHNLGDLMGTQGEYDRALPYLERALAMRRRLYPEAKYKDGHPHLALSLNNLGLLLFAQGEYGRARPHYEQALAMYQRFFPEARYPDGHPDLAMNLNNLGNLLNVQGEYGRAQDYYERALAMCQKLYPAARYPDGHPQLATILGNLGALLRDQGEYGRARPYYERALAMRQRLYPEAQYPDGHPLLALSLNNLGSLLQDMGEFGRARTYKEKALEMYRRLFPAARYPDGHPLLALSLSNLGLLHQAQGENARALTYFEQSLAMYQGLAAVFADSAAEAEALNFLPSLPDTRNVFLAASARLPETSPEACYRLLWHGKASLTQVLQHRQRLLRGVSDPAVRRRAEELLEVRLQLSRLLLAHGDEQAQARRQRLQELTDRKEWLERQLARDLPELARERARRRVSHADLAKALPARAAFLDLYRYQYVDFKRRRWDEGHYAAFVLRAGSPVVRVELGPAPPIEGALSRWRHDLAGGRDSPAAAELRRLVWEPLVDHLPRDLETVYVCPDGQLNAAPWAALPGRRPGTVLLEECAVALVPNGPALLEQLTGAPRPQGPGALLAVGAVSYDDRPAAVTSSAGESRVSRAADVGDRKVTWTALPATGTELDRVLALAGQRQDRPRLLERRGSSANAAQLLGDLPQARWAHLATHGFFAAPKSEVRQALLDERAFRFGVGDERRGAGARSPLVQTGLVLAGANLPAPKELDALLRHDGGLLTGEAIAGLDLNGLELAVLSACETGLGEAQVGEGVFGLRRAFHLAGCRNVVASLWKVDDEATCALMALFYRHLWDAKAPKPPLEALRQAQLTLYRHPELVPDLARARGLELGKAVKLPSGTPQGGKAGGARAPARLWAGFILSGPGR
jgi:CHAT domain-containing protein/tetratricopeptide (TPR) repeat protein